VLKGVLIDSVITDMNRKEANKRSNGFKASLEAIFDMRMKLAKVV
jgi:hypothetical protein